MTIRVKLRGAAVKIEATYGTDSIPSPTVDAVLCRKIDISEPLSQASQDREIIRASYGQYAQLLGAAFSKCSLEVEMAGFGTAGPAAPTPGLDALLRICGHARTVTPGTSVVYAPASTALSSATVYIWQDGTLHKFTGCFGDLSISMSEDQIPTYKFDLWGLYQPVTDAALPAFTLAGYISPVLSNAANTAAVSIHGFAAEVKSFTFQTGNQVDKIALIGSTRRLELNDRKASGSIELRATTVAMKDFWSDVQNSVLGAMSILHGTAVGNRVSISSTAGMQLTNPRFTEDRNSLDLTMDIRFVPSTAGNDEYAITVT